MRAIGVMKGLAAGTLAAMTAIATADANDDKTITGSNCYPFFEGSSWVRVPAGAYNLNQTDSVSVTCPILRDNTTNTTGLADVELQVAVSSGSMTCTAGAYDASAFGTIKTVVKTTTATGNSKLDWGAALNKSSSVGTYAIDCDVPPFGQIYSLRYSEF